MTKIGQYYSLKEYLKRMEEENDYSFVYAEILDTFEKLEKELGITQ